METKAIMLDSLKYIEKNINKPMTAEDIAKMQGIHYIIFQEYLKNKWDYQLWSM